jgi:Tol biopolymer transport system component
MKGLPSARLGLLMLGLVASAPGVRSQHAQPRIDRIEPALPDAASCSFDGQSAVFPNINGDLELLDLKSGERRTLVARQAGSHIGLVRWARRSRRLLYIRENLRDSSMDILALDVDVGQARVVAANGDYGAVEDWSADERFVLLRTASAPQRRMILSLGDGSTRTLPALGDNASHPIFSADGRYIAYEKVDGKTGTTEIRVADANGPNDRPLIRPAGSQYVSLLDWGPGDRSLLYTSDTNGTNDIWMVGIADGHIATRPPTRLLRSVGRIAQAGLTSSGDLSYRVSSRGAVFAVPLDKQTGRATAAPAPVKVPHPDEEGAPAWSSTGQLAFRAISHLDDNDGEFDAIVTLSTRGTPRWFWPAAPRGEDDIGGLSWAPDGRHLLVTGGGDPYEDEPKGAYSVNVADGQVATVVAKDQGTVSVGQARWLPDSQSIVYLESWTSIVERDLESGDERSIYRADPKDSGPLDSLAVSPDGTFVAFRNLRRHALMVASLSDGSVRDIVQLTTAPQEQAAKVAWSADGRFVIYVDTADEARSDVKRVAISGGQPESIGVSVDREIWDIAMQPGGGALALVMSDGDKAPGFYVVRSLVPVSR